MVWSSPSTVTRRQHCTRLRTHGLSQKVAVAATSFALVVYLISDSDQNLGRSPIKIYQHPPNFGRGFINPNRVLGGAPSPLGVARPLAGRCRHPPPPRPARRPPPPPAWVAAGQGGAHGQPLGPPRRRPGQASPPAPRQPQLRGGSARPARPAGWPRMSWAQRAWADHNRPTGTIEEHTAAHGIGRQTEPPGLTSAPLRRPLRRHKPESGGIPGKLAPAVGFEPTTNGLTVRCATAAPRRISQGRGV